MPIDIYDTRTMLEAVRQMMPVHTFLKDTFFSTKSTSPNEAIDVDFYKGRRKMAPFVSPRLAGQVITREGFVTKTYKPPMIKPMRAITGDDIIKRSMGETIYSTKSPDERAAEMAARDLAELDESITRREEWMASQVLFTGKVHMIGEGVDQVLDYNFSNNVALTGTDQWSDPASDPIADLKGWRLKVIQQSGVTPDIVVMASDVVDAFINHAKVQKVMDNTRIMLGQINPRQLPNGVTYIGSITSLGLDIYSYDEWYVDDETDPANPTEKPMVPAGNVLVGSTRARSTFAYGAVILTDNITKQFITVEGERVPDSWVEKNPPVRYLQLNSRPLPIPHEVDSWYVAQVL